MLRTHLVESKGINVKHILLCAVLIALVALVTAAQDRSSENKKDGGSESTPSTTIGSRAPWSWQPKGSNRPPTPFITFIESSATSTLLIRHRGYNAVDQVRAKLAGDAKLFCCARNRLNDALMGSGPATHQFCLRTQLRGNSFGRLVDQTIGRSSFTNKLRVGRCVSFDGRSITNMRLGLHSIRCGKGLSSGYALSKRAV